MTRSKSQTLDEVRAGVLRQPGLVGLALRNALADNYDALAQAPGRFGLSGHRASRWSPSAAWDGASWRPTPISTWCCCTTAGTATSPSWPTRSGTRSGTPVSVWTIRCVRPIRPSRWPRTTSRRCSACSTCVISTGDPALSAPLRERILDIWRSVAPKRVAELREISEERWALAGEAAFLLDPNVKESRGGLRDAQTVRAARRRPVDRLPGTPYARRATPCSTSAANCSGAPAATTTSCASRNTTASPRRCTSAAATRCCAR